jgi:hypothetical protein
MFRGISLRGNIKVLATRIRALRSKDQGGQNAPEQRRGNGTKRNDLAVAEAEPPTGGEV